MSLTLDKAMEEQRRYQFEAYAYRFIERWAPEDKHEAAQFSAELFGLVRQLFVDVQKPVQDTVAAVLAMQPTRTVIFGEPKSK